MVPAQVAVGCPSPDESLPGGGWWSRPWLSWLVFEEVFSACEYVCVCVCLEFDVLTWASRFVPGGTGTVPMDFAGQRISLGKQRYCPSRPFSAQESCSQLGSKSVSSPSVGGNRTTPFCRSRGRSRANRLPQTTLTQFARITAASSCAANFGR